MQADFQTLLSSTFYLLSRQRSSLPDAMQQRVTEHLAMLLQMPEMQQFPVLEDHCLKLFGEWLEGCRGNDVRVTH